MDGTLEQIGDHWRLRFTRRLPHPCEKVWRALTEPEHLEAWFPTTIEGERAAGAALRFSFRQGEGPPFTGEITTYEPPKALEFRWGENDTLRFELEPDGDGTILTLIDTFQQVGKAARDAAGWTVCLDVLGYHLNGEKPPWDAAARWRPVHSQYVKRFGPEASTIGPPEAMISR